MPALPMMSGAVFPRESGPGIRVPRDMTAGDAGAADFPARPGLPARPPTQQSLDFAAAPIPAGYAAPPQAAGYPMPQQPGGYVVHHEGPGFTGPPAVPGFTAPPAAAAGPSLDDTVATGPAPGPSSVWDLAATDGFPVSTDPSDPSPPPDPSPAPGAPEQDPPGATGT